jgi:membrane protein implicated in regulation of membrane protease activity
MSSRRQLVIFELLSGLFGWVWIGASLSAVGFVAMALLSDWSWWNVLYASIVGALAKWLARGFLDNRGRVLFEEHMIQQGLTKEDAARRWVDEYSKGSR